MKVHIIRVDGREEHFETTKGEAIAAIEKAIGADTLDGFSLRDGRYVFADDSGFIDGKPRNPKATALYHGICRPGTTHYIAGDVAIVRDEDFA